MKNSFQATLDKIKRDAESGKQKKTETSKNTGSSDVVLYVHQDQLNLKVFPNEIIRKKPRLVLIESTADASYLPFHKKKLVLEWSARRHFAIEAVKEGFPVVYLQTDTSSDKALKVVLKKNSNANIICMQPAEFTPRRRFEALKSEFDSRFEIIPNTFFMADPSKWAEKVRSGYRMEFFYREMRKHTGYLMDNGKPAGGGWNYDDKNRQSLPSEIEVSDFTGFKPDEVTREVQNVIDELFPEHFGSTDGFRYAVTRKEALEVLEHFIDSKLTYFGPYQDAMAAGDPFLFHSLLSPCLNLGLLTAREVCDAVLNAYEKAAQSNKDGNKSQNRSGKKHSAKDNVIPLNSVEGFIRQILGWREYIRIYYEAMMPEVRESNFFSYKQTLPDLYWSADTEMKCMQEAVESVRKHGYAHHIQRLMVLSNFSNLTASDPRKLLDWFWFAFVDAHEWVVLPNVLGMSTFADGGVLASKPYIAGGNYIRKMSDYCSGCRYRVQDRTGEDACPFNYLYWSFVDREREHLKKNPRIGFMLKTWNKKSEDEKEEIRKMSDKFIDNLKRYKQMDTAEKRKTDFLES